VSDNLAFIDNYRTLRQKFRPPVPVVIRPKLIEPPKEAVVDTLAREGTRNTKRDFESDMKAATEAALEEGVSYRQALLKGMPVCRPRYKLAVLPILEEYAISWENLFNGRRATFQTVIRWKLFDTLRQEGMTLIAIADLCRMDHSSVMYGLRKIKEMETINA